MAYDTETRMAGLPGMPTKYNHEDGPRPPDETSMLHEQLRQRTGMYQETKAQTIELLNRAIGQYDQRIAELQKMQADAQDKLKGLR